MLDDAYNYLRLRGLNGRHYTTAFPPNKGSSTLPNGRSVMDSSPTRANPGDGYQDGSQPNLFVWSASDEGGLKRLAGVYGDHIRTLNPAMREDTYLKNLAFTLSEKRTLLPWKGFTVAASLQALTTKLEAQSSKPVRSSTPNDLGFIFTGQGAQWNAMGRELFSYPEFKKSLLDAEAYIWDLGCTWSLIGTDFWFREVYS